MKNFLLAPLKLLSFLLAILKLGFIIHPEKSSIQPSQETTYLGFIFNSKEMSVTLTGEKREKIIESCKSFF